MKDYFGFFQESFQELCRTFQSPLDPGITKDSLTSYGRRPLPRDEDNGRLLPILQEFLIHFVFSCSLCSECSSREPAPPSVPISSELKPLLDLFPPKPRLRLSAGEGGGAYKIISFCSSSSSTHPQRTGITSPKKPSSMFNLDDLMKSHNVLFML